MMKNKSYDTRTTEEGFRKYLKKRAFTLSVLIASGIAIFIWSSIENGSDTGDHTRNFLLSFSVTIVIIGAMRMVQTIRCIKLPEKFQKAYTDYTDERNRFVRMKSYSYSAYIFILLTALAIIVINVLGLPSVISNTLAACMGVFALILTITYRIMNKIN